MESQIYFKGLLEYLNSFLNIPRNTALDIASQVNINNLNSILDLDLRYYLPDSTISKLKTNIVSMPLKPCSYLLGIGFSPKMTEQILRYYGPSDKIINIINENPYEILNVESVNFKKIDKIALEVLNLEESDPRRKKHYLIHHLNNLCYKNGHLYIDLDKFINSKFEIKLKKEEAKKYLSELIISKKIYLQGKKLYPSVNYIAEKRSAEIICEIIKYKEKGSFFKEVDPFKFIKGYEDLQTQNIEKGTWKNLKWKNDKFSLSDKQKEVIKKFIEESFLIVTGLPGSGKTATIKALVDISKSRGLKITLMAPTGIAAKRLAESTGFEATTIHKKLGFDGVFWNKKEGELTEDIIIVDEFSMVDQSLLYQLLQFLPKKEFKLVFVGDAAQLPSVAPGNVLKELTSNGRIPHIALDKIFRQEDTSDIILNAHLINSGNTKLINKNNDFVFIESETEEKSLDIIYKIVDKIKDKNYQILSPTYKGILGVININMNLQDTLNPKLDEITFKTDTYNFRIDDKIMVIKNDYQNEVYNGEPGILKDINVSKKTIKIFINGKTIEYPFRDAYSILTLDHVRTVHKTQGMEYDYIILPWVKEFSIQLQRNLLYTAVTRAKKKIFIVGNKDALDLAIKNNHTSKRNSILSSRILTELEK